MQHILGIETATDVCSVAVASDGDVRCSFTVDMPRRHAEQLVPMIGHALDTAELSPSDLDAVAVSAGPGSYTGLRIGVSTAKGICVATGAPFIPVPSLRALASVAEAAIGSTVIAAFRSRRHEVYAASFSVDGSPLPAPRHEPFAGPADQAVAALAPASPDPPVLVGDGAILLAGVLRREGIAYRHHARVRPTASAVARMAVFMAQNADPVDVDRFEPYYLRDFAARPATASAFDRLPF